MEHFKKLVKYSMKLITEADEYAGMYNESNDSICKEVYYALANGHMDMYLKVRGAITNMVNKIKDSDNNSSVDVIWEFLKDTEDELLDRVKNKIK